jgi:hypothetical protein
VATQLVASRIIELIISSVGRYVRFEVFNGGDYEEWRLLGCYAMWLLPEPTFRRNVAPP